MLRSLPQSNISRMSGILDARQQVSFHPHPMTQVHKVKVTVDVPVQADRLLFLDGLRGWAALMVVLSHLLIFFVAHTSTVYRNWYWAFASDGNLAVFVFFVLSGFALSIGYIQTGRLNIVTSLCVRRYLRLAIPVLCTSLLAYLLHASGLFYNDEAGTAMKNAWLATFYGFSPNFLESIKFGLHDVFINANHSKSYNPILWTMSIELFGSFIVFAICALVLHLKKRALLLAIIVLFFVMSKHLYYVAFLCGIAIALCYHHREQAIFRKIHLALPLVLLLVVYYSTVSLRGNGLAVPGIARSDYFSIVASCSLVFAATFYAPFRRFLETPVSRYLGSISFPIYLTHFLVICSFSSGLVLYLVATKGNYPEWGVHLNVAASLAVCFMVAHFFRHIENFSIVAARKFADFVQK